MAEQNRVHEIPLPTGAEAPVRVFVNGEEWAEGVDFQVVGDHIRFVRTLRARPALGLRRSVMLAMGIGVYDDLRGDTLDLQYHAGGQTRTATIPIRSAAAASPPPA